MSTCAFSINRAVLCAIVLPISLLFCDNAGAQRATGGGGQAPSAIFLPVDPSQDIRGPANALQRRAARINFEAVSRARSRGSTLRFNLFPDVIFDGVVESLEEKSDGSYILSGRLQDHPDSSFALAVNDEVMMANIRPVGGGLYQVRYFGNGLHDIRQADEDAFPPCTTGPEQEIHFPKEAPAAAGDVTTADTADTIDVVVLYTPSARTAAGGTSAIQALIDLAINESNTAYQQSQITPQLRLRYKAEVPYTEAGSMSTDLSRLRGTTDGFLDGVHALRNAYGADLVALIVNESSSCGIAYLMTTLNTNFAPNGFSVTHWDCATGYYTFAHELGHNMGCAHDRANASSALYTYSYGWRFAVSPGTTNRTIMAYAPGTRVQRFSNPDVTYSGAPTGVATNLPDAAHNALSINNAAFTVANFRQAVASTSNIPAIIIAPPLSTIAMQGTTVNLSVGAGGTPTLFYQWRRDSTNLPSATGSTYSIPNVQQANAGNYSVIVSNAYGAVTSAVATLSVCAQYTLGVSVDNPGLVWSTGGNAVWIGQGCTTRDGQHSAQSGAIADSQQSWIQTTIAGPGTLRFWWKVSSEANYDYLRLYTNGVAYTNVSPIQISGEQSWVQVSVPLASGNQVCQWRYLKDGSVASGEDRGWLDGVSFIAGSTVQSNSVAITNGGVQFRFTGVVGASYTIQGSTNFTSWQNLTNLVSTNTSILFIDSNATNFNRRYYRIVSP